MCLLPFENEKYININIHLSKTKDTSSKKLTESIDIDKKYVNLNIGEAKVLTDIDLYDDYLKDNFYEKNLLIKMDNHNFYYSLENPVFIY